MSQKPYKMIETTVWHGKKPKIITLCGSTRFRKQFEEVQAKLTLQGSIVISVGLFGHSGGLTEVECQDGHPTKTMLDELHKRKIDLSDEIYVINPGGYVGTSTQSEIEYAFKTNKPVSYLVPPICTPPTNK